jgi:hypothetical protein
MIPFLYLARQFYEYVIRTYLQWSNSDSDSDPDLVFLEDSASSFVQVQNFLNCDGFETARNNSIFMESREVMINEHG